MNAIRKTLKPRNGLLTIELPKDFTQKEFEVTVVPVEEKAQNISLQFKLKSLLESLPKSDPEISLEEIITEIKEVRKNEMKVVVDTNIWVSLAIGSKSITYDFFELLNSTNIEFIVCEGLIDEIVATLEKEKFGTIFLKIE